MAKALKDLLKEEGADQALIDDPYFKDVPDAPTLAKRARDTASMVGSSLRVPGANATSEERASFRKALGERVPDLMEVPTDEAGAVSALRSRGLVPKEAKEYSADGLVPAEGITQLPDDVLEALRKEAAETGLTKSGFKLRAQKVLNDLGARKRAAAEGQSALRQEWGAAYETRLAEVRGIVEQTGAPEDLKASVAAGNIDKKTASWLIGLGKRLGTTPAEVSRQDGSGPGEMSPSQAEEKIRAVLNNPIIKENKRSDPMYRQLLAEIRRLEPFAHPDLARGE